METPENHVFHSGEYYENSKRMRILLLSTHVFLIDKLSFSRKAVFLENLKKIENFLPFSSHVSPLWASDRLDRFLPGLVFYAFAGHV